MNKIKNIFINFKFKNFRLFFPSIALIQAGVWAQQVVFSWLIYKYTQNALNMGIIMFLNTIPTFILTLVIGPIIDKFDRHKLLKFVQFLYICQSVSLLIFESTGFLNIYCVIFFSILLNSISALESPIRQSSYILVVPDRKYLVNAISMDSFCYGFAKVIGTSLGGFLSYLSISFCLFTCTLFFITSFLLISKMSFKDIKFVSIKSQNIFKSISLGFIYSIKNYWVIIFQIYLFFFNTITGSYKILLPILISVVLGENIDDLGYFLTAIGFGSIITSLVFSTKKSVRVFRIFLFIGCLLVSTVFIFVGSCFNYYLILCAMFFLGVGRIFFSCSQNILVQSVVDDYIRGRVMSINSLASLGTASLSSIIVGIIVHKFGINISFILLGCTIFFIACILSNLCYIISKINLKNAIKTE